jgi:hypothetical protein
MMWDRVFGRPKETVAVEKEDRLGRIFDSMSTEELEAYVRDTRHLRAVKDEEAAEN